MITISDIYVNHAVLQDLMQGRMAPVCATVSLAGSRHWYAPIESSVLVGAIDEWEASR